MKQIGSYMPAHLKSLAVDINAAENDPTTTWGLALDHRAVRSLWLIGINVEFLNAIHNREIELALSGKINWFLSLTAMREISDWDGNRDFKFKMDDISSICRWVVKFKPSRADSDDLWHGMRYEHAWDWNSRIKKFPDLRQNQDTASKIRVGLTRSKSAKDLATGEKESGE